MRKGTVLSWLVVVVARWPSFPAVLTPRKSA